LRAIFRAGQDHLKRLQPFPGAVVFATAVDERGAFKSIAGFASAYDYTRILVAVRSPGGLNRRAHSALHWPHTLGQSGVYWVGHRRRIFAGLLYDLYSQKALTAN